MYVCAGLSSTRHTITHKHTHTHTHTHTRTRTHAHTHTVLHASNESRRAQTHMRPGNMSFGYVRNRACMCTHSRTLYSHFGMHCSPARLQQLCVLQCKRARVQLRIEETSLAQRRKEWFAAAAAAAAIWCCCHCCVFRIQSAYSASAARPHSHQRSARTACGRRLRGRHVVPCALYVNSVARTQVPVEEVPREPIRTAPRHNRGLVRPGEPGWAESWRDCVAIAGTRRGWM